MRTRGRMSDLEMRRRDIGAIATDKVQAMPVSEIVRRMTRNVTSLLDDHATIGDVIEVSPESLLTLPNVGKVTVSLIYDTIDAIIREHPARPNIRLVRDAEEAPREERIEEKIPDAALVREARLVHRIETALASEMERTLEPTERALLVAAVLARLGPS